MVLPREIITKSPKETFEFGQKMATNLVLSKHPRIICLYGELGSGKTTFVQGLAQGLGVGGRLLSPTFIIMRRYKMPTENFFYHLDLYRLNQSQELDGLGIFEIFTDKNSFVAIEWAERLGELLPENRLEIHFSTDEDGKHKLKLNEVN